MKKDVHKELIVEIASLYDSKEQDEVMLDGVFGETFFIRHKIEIISVFKKDGNIWFRLSDKERNPYDTKSERRIDDFTWWTLLKIKEKLELV